MTACQRSILVAMLLIAALLLVQSIMTTDHYVEDWMDHLPVGITEPTLIDRTVP